mgnify:CR=1 FL=1
MLAAFLPWAFVGGVSFWAITSMASCAQQSQLKSKTLEKDMDESSYKVVGPHSVFYKQSSISEISFHFNSKTVFVEHESAEDTVRIYNFSEFEAQDLIEESRRTGCEIALNFLDNEEEYEEKLTEDRFEELSKRLGPFAKDYCEASTSGELQSEPTSPSLS